MYKKNFTPLFAMFMILMLMPFLPSYIRSHQESLDTLKSLTGIPTTYAASRPVQASDYTSAGYLGAYGLSAVPFTDDLQPRVLGVSTVRQASSPPRYQAQEVSRSIDILNLNPGQGYTVWVDFLNTGSSTWYNDGPNYVAVNVTAPAGRQSIFQHKFWKKNYQPARLSQRQVRPGQIGRFRLALQAPINAAGEYIEEFNLIAENKAWIDGGYFQIPIGVGKKYDRPYNYQAQEVNRSQGGTLTLQPGQAITFWIDFKNIGLKNWHNTGTNFLAVNVTGPLGRVSLFKHDYWKEYYYRPTRLLQSRIYPGETGRFRFALQAPNVAGYYTEKFVLVAENYSVLPGGEFTIDFKVGNPPEPVAVSSGEPNIRVGLYSTGDPVTIACNGAYQLVDGNTNTATDKAANEATTVSLSDTAYYRFVPKDSGSIMTITSWTNKPTWNSSLNDNTFRGVIEVRYAASDKTIWVINELPLESYLRGLAEVANGQPTEYLKALITSARSYALWHYYRGGKHPNEHFDINATTDQVYRGYGFEQRSIDPLAAVQATAGLAITHPDAVSQLNPEGVIVAPYSSGTDGRTRSWQEVWNSGGFPWCLSVADPYGILSNATTLEGNHMVGLSAKGARGYAEKENKTYDWILKYYYTGVAIEKIY